jgi:tetratricopeptide (TPR) repeat protein
LDAQKQRLHAEAVRLKEEYEKSAKEETKAEFLTVKERFEAKSMELAQHRIKCYPNHTGYRYDYGILLQKNGQIKEAIAEFQLAKVEVTRKGECLLALGQCFQRIKQHKLAVLHYHEAVSVLETGESKKKALYLAMKLTFVLGGLKEAEEYGHQLAAIDFSYRDLSEILDQIAKKRSNIGT